MGAFELKDTTVEVEPMFAEKPEKGCPDPRRVIDECVIAHKVYDSCRRQNCLTVQDIGEALAEEHVVIDGVEIPPGGSIIPPAAAVSVAMDNVRIKSITVDKHPSPFRAGYWEIGVKYDLVYDLTFREAKGTSGQTVKAMNVYDIKVTMFGSVSSDLSVVTDMYQETNKPTLSAAPYTWVEAKVIGLDSKIAQGVNQKQINVTVGLFSILKLFRLVHLNVQSKGFCVPGVCKDIGKVDPCKYFSKLDFPMDIFAPPQFKEFTENR